MDPTEPTQFTLEGNEVAQIANMDTNAAAEAHHAAEVAAQQAELQAASAVAVEQVEVIHTEEPQLQHQHQHQHQHQQQHHNQHQHQHQHQLSEPLPGEMDIDQAHTHIATMPDAHIPIPTLVHAPLPTEQQTEPAQVDPIDEPTWHNYFAQLQKHQSTYRTLDVDPQTNPPLYEWVEEQRKMFKLDKISPERMLLLNALSFDWEGNQEPNYGIQAAAAAAAANSTISGPAHDVETFHLRLSQIQEYKNMNGHANIPESYKENPALGKWIHQQRLLFNKHSLAQDRIDALTSIGFDFATKDKSIIFDTRVEQLKAYRALHGDINVPRSYTNKCLGEWLWNQKRLYRRWESGREGGMGANRRRILMELGVDFSDPSQNEGDSMTTKATKIPLYQEDVVEVEGEGEEIANRSTKWDDKFHELRKYKLIQGHTNVPRRSKRNPANDALGEWVHFQRRQYRNLLNGKNSTLTIARKKALEVLDFQWSRTGNAFHHGHAHGNSHINFVDKKNTVRDAVQIQILKAHEEGKTAPWDDRFAQLTEYVQRFGNADVPINYAENLSLGSWVYRQRIAHKLWKRAADISNAIQNSAPPPQSLEACDSSDINKPANLIQAPDIVNNQFGGDELESPIAQNTNNFSQPLVETSQSPQESVTNMDKGHSETLETHDLGSDQVEITHNPQLPIEIFHIEAPQSVIANDFNVTHRQSNNEPAFLEVDRMTQERYDKLVAVGFDFEIKKIPDDFITADGGQEPAVLILSKTAEEEEKPLVEDDEDILEIHLGFEEALPEVNPSTKPDMEINDVEVSAILNGSNENTAAPAIDSNIPLPTVTHNNDIDGNVNENIEGAIETPANVEGTIAPTASNTNEEEKIGEPIIAESKDDIEDVTAVENGVALDAAMVEHNEAFATEGSPHMNDPDLETPQNVAIMNIDHEMLDKVHHNGEPNLVQNEVSTPTLPPMDDKLGEQDNDKIINQPEAMLTQAPVEENVESNIVSDVVNLQGNNTEQSIQSAETPMPINDNKDDTINALTEPVHIEGHVDQAPSTNSSNEIEQSKQKKGKASVTVQVEWEERILELIQYKIRKRNCDVPMKWKPNPGLSSWVWRQRDQYRLYRLGLPSTLTATRIAKLTELGFEFVIHDAQGNPVYHDESKVIHPPKSDEKLPHQEEKPATRKQKTVKPTPKSRFKEGKWLQSLAKVVAYKERNGNCNVPRKWKKDPTLGEWVHFQRRQYRLKQLNRRNHMTEERIQKLEAIGFEWSRGTSSFSRYSEHEHQKDVHVYMERPEEQQVASAEMPLPNTDQMMVEYMDCREEAQQIADVVEQHVTEGEQQLHIQVDHQVVHENNMELKIDHEPHQPDVMPADIEPIPVTGSDTVLVHGIEVHHTPNEHVVDEEDKDDDMILSV